MSFAPPIAREGFYYNGDLYVEVGNLNRHKRASIPEITAILRPDLKQSKATLAASPFKDPVGHWYEAQLIHYGLPPSKDKARAKMRLLEALNSAKLAVPAGIVKLEAQLKKEYAAADKKAKAQYKAEMAIAGKSDPTTAGKKRKQSEPTSNVNVNINFGPYAGPYGGQQLQMTPNSTAGMGESFGAQTKPPATKKAKTSAAAAPEKTKSAIKDDNQASTKKETAAKGTSTAKKKAMVKEEPSNNASTPVRPKQTARWSGPAKKEPATHKETTPKKEAAVKKEPKVKSEPNTASLPKLGLINGYYDISCPNLEGQWRGYGDDMSIILCLDSPGVWGAYDFGMFSGILHLEDRPWEASYEPIPCKWRGRENSEGQMSFGESCTGEIAFLGGGRIEGYLNMYGQCHFSGTRVPGPGSAPRTAASMKQEWNGYNERAYDDEARDRWR